MIAPVVPVLKQSDKIAEIDPTFQAFRIVDSTTGSMAKGPLFDFDVSTAARYFSEKHQHRSLVSDEEKANADAAIAPFLNKTWLLMGLHNREKEAELLARLAAALTGDLTESPSDKWDNYAAATSPFDYITDKIHECKVRGGVKPNAFSCDEFTFVKLMNHPDIMDRFRNITGAVPAVAGAIYTGGLSAMKATFSAVFGIPYVNVAENCLMNTAAEGDPAVVEAIWGDSALLHHYEAPRIGSTPTLANFAWTVGADGQATNGVRTRIYRDKNGDEWDTIEVTTYRDIKTLLPATGFLFTDTLAII